MTTFLGGDEFVHVLSGGEAKEGGIPASSPNHVGRRTMDKIGRGVGEKP